jgi:hypothetical protein
VRGVAAANAYVDAAIMPVSLEVNERSVISVSLLHGPLYQPDTTLDRHVD